MASWSRQRRSLYAALVVVVLAAAAGLPAYFIFHKTPSCSNGIKDGDELGIDCGGSCQKLCPSSFLTPIVSWTRFEQIAPGLYNAAAYVVNPNPNAGATDVPYDIQLFDDHGVLVSDTPGVVTLPPHRNTLAFLPSIDTGKRVPAKASFEFTGIPDWTVKADTLSPLVVSDKKYSEDAGGSSLSVSLRNSSAFAIGPLSVYAILYDAARNEVGFSRTKIDGIPADGTAVAPYTWPDDRHGAVVSIEVLPVAE